MDTDPSQYLDVAVLGFHSEEEFERICAECGCGEPQVMSAGGIDA